MLLGSEVKNFCVNQGLENDHDLVWTSGGFAVLDFYT